MWIEKGKFWVVGRTSPVMMRPWSVIINGRLFRLWLQLQESLSRWMLRPVLAERRWRQLSTLVAQGTTVRCREGSEMPEHTAGIGFSPELATSGVRRVTGWCVLKISRAMAFNTDCNLSKIWGHASQGRVAAINLLTASARTMVSKIWHVREHYTLHLCSVSTTTTCEGIH